MQAILLPCSYHIIESNLLYIYISPLRSFQGWAIIHWETALQASQFLGFKESAPPGKFVVIDMSMDGSGEWQKWDNSSFLGAPFIWTTLHNFGGTDGMKGNLARINSIPSALQPTTAIGTGFTPEGINQNTFYYELMIAVNFHTAPLTDLTSFAVLRAHRRYGLLSPGNHTTLAWTLLSHGAYSQDDIAQDGTGVPHLPGYDTTHFLPDRHTPVPELCLTFQAWGALLAAAESEVDPTQEPFRYDLVNLGREILAQLSTPMSNNFSDALNAHTLDPIRLQQTGQVYIDLLGDIDALVGTDFAFLLGPWISAARKWGEGASDCADMPCTDFYEWNARSQLTTWNPTPYGASVIPDGPIDYASKHWAGLISDYYQERAKRVLAQAMYDAAASRPLNLTAVEQLKATLAYTWTTATNAYPSEPVGDAVAVSKTMLAKYAPFFSSC